MIRRITWLAVVSPDLGQGSTGRDVMAIDVLSIALKLDVPGRHADALAREAQFGKLCRHRNVVATQTWES